MSNLAAGFTTLGIFELFCTLMAFEAWRKDEKAGHAIALAALIVPVLIAGYFGLSFALGWIVGWIVG